MKQQDKQTMLHSLDELTSYAFDNEQAFLDRFFPVLGCSLICVTLNSRLTKADLIMDDGDVVSQTILTKNFLEWAGV